MPSKTRQTSISADQIGTLTNLTTTDKSSITNSVIEVDTKLKDMGYNVKRYGAIGSSLSTNGSITSGSNVLTLVSAIDFINGQYINVYGGYEVASLSVTAGATSSANCTVTLNGVAQTIALTSGNTATQVATAIRSSSFPFWTTGGSGTSVTFTSNLTGNKTDATYSAGTTGATGSMTTPTQGVNDLNTTILSGAGTTSLTLAINASATVSGVVVAHDESPTIQATINAMPSIGGTMYFPDGTYNLSADITFGSKTINLIMNPNVKFTGYGKMPTTLTNPYHQLIQNYQVLKPDTVDQNRGYGYSTISAEIAPTSTFFPGAAAVAGYFGAISPTSGSSFIWALNPIVHLSSGFSGNGIGIEVDIDNYQSDFSGQGILITGLGNYRPQVALKIERAGGGTVPAWSTGISINNFEHGILMNGVYTNAVMGLEIVGMDNQHIHLQSSNDLNPDNAVFYVTSSDASQVMFKVSKAGYLLIGSGGTEIKKHLHGISPVVNFGSISANSTAELTFTFTGVTVSDTVVLNNASLAAGFVFNAWASAANTITVRMANVTIGALDPDGAGGSQFVVDVWQH